MARLLDVSAKTVERWEHRGTPPPSLATRIQLAKLREIATVGLVVYTQDGFQAFLTTPLGELEGRTPLQLIEQGRADDVLSALATDYEGLGP
jgi:transcriptional regulator with XRE-family HTH domain